MKKKKKQNIVIAAVILTAVGILIGYNYSVDQEKFKGFTFGNELQQIQDDLKEQQTNFYSRVTALEEGDYTKDSFLDYSDKHVSNMEKLLLRYDNLNPPEPFSSSIVLFKLSTESQLESDKQLTLWLDTEDESYKIRSDYLLQEAIDYELAALERYDAAKRGENP